MKPNALVVKVETQQFIALSKFDEDAIQSGEVLGREATFSDDDAEWFEE